MSATNVASKTTFKDLALPWIARGFKVIPVARAEKRPVWVGWPDLASNTPEGLAALQAMADNDGRYTEWNFGLVADPAIHCVLDCDSPGLVEQIERETGHKIPDTLTVLSANKGCPHKYFLPTERSTALGNPSTGKLDFWTSRHQTVGPGSIGTSGRKYEVIRDVPMVPIPDWLCDWIAKQEREWSAVSGDPNAGALGRLKAAYLKNLNPEDLYGLKDLDIRSGLHPTIHSLACVLHDGERDADDLKEILDKVWEEYGHRRQQYSNHETEVEGIVRQVLKKEPCRPGQSGVLTFGNSLPAPKRRRFSHAELLARVSAEPEPQIIEGLLGIRAQAIAVGESTIGKTPLFLQMALSVANGKPFLGMPVKQGRVMILDYENEESPLADMLGALSNFLGTRNPVDGDMLQIVTSPASQKEAFEEVSDFKPALVIVDSLRGFDPLAETKSEAAALMYERLKRFETAWLIIHHPRKDSRQQR